MSEIAREIASPARVLAPRRRDRRAAKARRSLPPVHAPRLSGAAPRWFIAQAYAALRGVARAGRDRRVHGLRGTARPPVRRPWSRSPAAARRPRSSDTSARCRALDASRSSASTDTPSPRPPTRSSLSRSPTSARSCRRGSRRARSRSCARASARTSVPRSPTRNVPSGCRCRSRPRRIDHFVFLGVGWSIGLANEAALKLREAAQAWTESYPAMEYRHGPISVAGPRSLVWALGEVDDGVLDDGGRHRGHGRRRRARPDGRADRDPADGGGVRRGSRAGPGSAAAPHPFGGVVVTDRIGGSQMRRTWMAGTAARASRSSRGLHGRG